MTPGQTLEQENQLERVLGSRGRSGGWWDGWQAAWSPAGEDGYPRPIWDKQSGAIDPVVAAHWREHHDPAGDEGDGLARKLHPGLLEGAGEAAVEGALVGESPCGGASGEAGAGDATWLARLLPVITAHLLEAAP